MTTYFIYSITNTANGFVYVGITIDYDSRIRGHKWQLSNLFDHASVKTSQPRDDTDLPEVAWAGSE